MQKSHLNILVVSSVAVILLAVAFFLYNKFFKFNANIADDFYIPPAEVARISPAENLPAISFKDEFGKLRHIKEFQGKILLINFWASWCKPCTKELPQLDQMTEIFGAENFEVIAISIDSAIDTKKLRKFYQKIGIKNLKIYQDKDLAAYEEVMSFGVPTTILVDRNLKAHLKVSGYLEWSNPEIMSLISSL